VSELQLFNEALAGLSLFLKSKFSQVLANGIKKTKLHNFREHCSWL
jgi:hypothetical protein